MTLFSYVYFFSTTGVNTFCKLTLEDDFVFTFVSTKNFRVIQSPFHIPDIKIYDYESHRNHDFKVILKESTGKGFFLIQGIMCHKSSHSKSPTKLEIIFSYRTVIWSLKFY